MFLGVGGNDPNDTDTTDSLYHRMLCQMFHSKLFEKNVDDIDRHSETAGETDIYTRAYPVHCS